MAPAAKKSKGKSKRSGVGIDFKKLKHKVGRKIPAPQNATKVEFKSKKIILHEQSVKVDKDGLAVNQRNKTLKELFNQIAHYNTKVRKDALIGIKDLFSRHPKELECNAITAIQKLTSRFTDPDKGVRQALLSLLRETFANLSEIVMKPIITLVIAHLGTAMTHLATDIRLDAFTFLDLLIQHYPSLLVPVHTGQIFEHYIHFLGSHKFDPNATLAVVSSLARLLSVLSSSSSSKSTSQNPGTSQRWSEKYDIYTLRPLHSHKRIIADVSEQYFAVDDEGSGSKWIDISSLLIDALLKCWAELAPTVCSSPLPDALGLDCLVSITRSLCLLLDWLENLSKNKLELRRRFLYPCSTRLMSSFPLSAPAVRTVAKTEESLCALNAGICETMLHFLVPGFDDFNFDAVFEFYEGALRGKLLSSTMFSVSGNPNKGTDLLVRSLLEFAPVVFDCADINWKQRILQVMTDAFHNSPPESVIKLGCLNAMSKILLSENYDRKGAVEHFSKVWLLSFSKLLWELKSNQPKSSKIVLEMLLQLGRFAAAGSTLASDYGKLQAAMIPFFCTVLSSAKESPDKFRYGPFVKLPKDCQELAVDILYYFRGFQHFVLKSLLACCLSPEMDLQILVRLLEVIQVSFVQGRVEVGNFLSFLLSLVVESSNSERKKQFVILGVVSRSLLQIGDAEVVLHLLSKPLTEHLLSRSSPSLLISSLNIVATLSKDLETVEVPEALLDVLAKQTASFGVSKLLEREDTVLFIVRYAVYVALKNKNFLRTLMKEFTLKLSGGKDQIYAVGVLTNQIFRTKGIEQQLELQDVNQILQAVKEITKEASVGQSKFNQLFELESNIRAAFGLALIPV